MLCAGYSCKLSQCVSNDLCCLGPAMFSVVGQILNKYSHEVYKERRTTLTRLDGAGGEQLSEGEDLGDVERLIYATAWFLNRNRCYL